MTIVTVDSKLLIIMNNLLKQKKTILILSLFTLLSLWWGYVKINDVSNENTINLLAGSYGLVALVGGLFGLAASIKWGGFKSILGRSLMMFSIGLLLQEFGQLSYAYYVVVEKIEIPYPSIGDIGYLGSVFFYIYGTLLLLKVVGAKFSLHNVVNKIQAVVIPVIILAVSYNFFLKGYSTEGLSGLTVALDFGYPFGQAIYLSLAILALIFSRKLLGGVMRPRIMLLLLALCLQYASDFNFLYQTHQETWQTAGYGDYLYLLSYLLMALSLIGLSLPLSKKQTDQEQK